MVILFVFRDLRLAAIIPPTIDARFVPVERIVVCPNLAIKAKGVNENKRAFSPQAFNPSCKPDDVDASGRTEVDCRPSGWLAP